MYLYLPVNPEPWAIGPLQVGKRGGKMFPSIGRNQQLASYKEAVREAIQSLPNPPEKLEGQYELYFWFWRRLDTYTRTESGRQVTKNVVDATNLQKATEDALQGVLIENDRDVVQIGAAMVEQGPDVVGGVGIFARQVEFYTTLMPTELVEARYAHLTNPAASSDNTWPPA
jgi:Holliday junction resolvase RusA-like endonuclease